MPLTEMERHVIESIKERFGETIDLQREPAVILEILRRYRHDLDRTAAAPEEYVQVRTGAVGGVSQADRAPPRAAEDDGREAAVSGEVTNTELMRELQRIRKDVAALATKLG